MADFFIRSRPTTNWAASTVYALGDRRLSTGAVPARGIHFEVTTAGTSGGAEPAWNTTIGGTTTDNTVTWTTRGSATNWVASTAYVVGDRVVATTAATGVRQAKVFECTTAGTSGGAEPAWTTTIAGTTTDNTVTWTTRNATNWNDSHPFLIRFNSSTGPHVSGDTVFYSHTHTEIATANAATLIGGTGTITVPVRHLCVNDVGDPAVPTTLATTAIVNNNNSVTLSGPHYWRGFKFNVGTGASTHTMSMGSSTGGQVLENCHIKMVSTATTATINATDNSGTGVVWRNVTVEFSATSQQIDLGGGLTWLDTPSAIVGATTPTNLFEYTVFCGLRVSGVDLSALGAGKNIFLLNASGIFGEAFFHGVKLNSAVGLTSGSLNQHTGGRVHVTYSGSGSDPLNYEYRGPNGTWTEELTLIRTGGANDGTAGFAWRCVTEANAVATPTGASVSDWITTYNSATGAPVTVTVEILHDSATALTDKEIWLEVEALTIAATLQTDYSDDFAGHLAAGANQASSTTTWTTTGMANPNKQKLGVTITPQIRGPVRARVYVAKASKTVFVDPKLTIA